MVCTPNCTSGAVYAFLGVEAVRILLGSAGGGGSKATDWTARLMAQPFGVWLVGMAGVILAGTGCYQFYRAYTAKFREKLKLYEMSEQERKWATRAGRIGIGEALQKLNQQPYGPWLLGLVAVGLMAYGLYAFVLARYRRIFFLGS